MDYRCLLDITTELGYELAMSGAETFRVEESITRICAAYGVNAEVFAIPNCLTVSLETEDQKPMTRMRRIGHHGTDLDAVERYNSLSRKLCAEKPEPNIAKKWLHEAIADRRQFPLWIYLLGNILTASGFTLAYYGSITDTICAGLCGLFIGLINYFLGRMKVNMFFSTIASAFAMGLIAYTAGSFGLLVNTDGVVISSLMLLVPGLLFTNALRDIIYGDTNSGINRIVQVLLIGVAIALGTGFAGNLIARFHIGNILCTPIKHNLILECVTTFFACYGFVILFNIHGRGSLLCALGGALGWAVFRLCQNLWIDGVMAYFVAAFFVAAYSEFTARIRKCPAISYLVVSIIPLLPGAGIYYSTAAIMDGNMSAFSDKAIETISIAGSMAVGILIVSTIARLWSIYNAKKHGK